MRDHLILAGAFHKTGTVLMAKTFRGVAKALDLRFREGQPNPAQSNPAQSNPTLADPAQTDPALADPAQAAARFDIGFDQRARFTELAGGRAYRAVVCFRDPRDVVISAAHYHCRSSEAWLHSPKDEFEGKTYQQHILGLDDDEARYLFELRRSAKRAIRGMLAFAEPSPDVCVTRMETLVADTELVEFRRIFTFLGFTEAELPACLEAARAASLFGQKTAKSSVHVRSGGRAEQWREAFSPRLMRAWLRLYPGVAEQLGYPPSVMPRRRAA
jgi:hypothetical protein